MTQELLERLKGANPVPDDPGAPPIETVLARIESAGPHRRWVGPDWRPGLLPALGAVAAIAVVVVALALAGHRASPSKPASPTPAHGAGLPGVVAAGGSFAPGGLGIITLNQCHPCQTSGPGQVEHNWVISTGDGGRTWHTVRTGFALGTGVLTIGSPVASGRDVWATGISRVGLGPQRFDFYVSHDGGASWRRARIPEPGFAGSVSISDGVVWATSGGTCIGRHCAGAEVLRGSAAGHALTPVGRTFEPTGGAAWSVSSALQVAAGGAGTAYLQVITARQAERTLVTHDAGRHWTEPTPQCQTVGAPDGLLRAIGDAVLWQLCPLPGSAGQEINVSTDGGRSWFSSVVRAWGGIKDLQPVSGRDAWVVTDAGTVLLTNDGGHSWHEVWSADWFGPRPRLPVVSPLSGREAMVTATQTFGRRTRVIVYRVVANGRGPTWQYVPLP